MYYGRRPAQLGPRVRTSSVAETGTPARMAWRWAALTLAAASALLAVRDAGAQTTGHAGRKSARTGRASTGRATTTGATTTGATAVPTSPVAPTRADSSPRAAAADDAGRVTRLAVDTAAGNVAPTPPAIGPPTVPAPPAGSTIPDGPNVAGAPNFAGHLTASLIPADVAAPLVATVSGGTGADVVHVQVLLDAARFSPGSISGVWNENTVFAIRAFRGAVHLPAGDSADAAVVTRLERLVGARAPLTNYVVTAADVRGPYRRVPGSMYEKAKVACLCYSSMLEMLGERFHTTPDALRQLNPDVDVAHARVGARLVVPNVERGAPPSVARLVVDKHEGSIRGLDARGATRFWLPATVGSPNLPSPTGRLHVVEASLNPRYRYDPVVLGEERGARPNAILAPGPNSPVGVLWAQLSRPHVGLHGTPDPEDVGYTMSHGCVRMANWDARWLVPLLRPGLPVDFQ